MRGQSNPKGAETAPPTIFPLGRHSSAIHSLFAPFHLLARGIPTCLFMINTCVINSII